MSEANEFSEMAELSRYQAHTSKVLRNIFLGITAVGLLAEGGLKLAGVEVPANSLYLPLGTGLLAGTFEGGRRWNNNRVQKMEDEAVALSMLVEDPTITESHINLVADTERVLRKSERHPE